MESLRYCCLLDGMNNVSLAQMGRRNNDEIKCREKMGCSWSMVYGLWFTRGTCMVFVCLGLTVDGWFSAPQQRASVCSREQLWIYCCIIVFASCPFLSSFMSFA